MHMIRHAADAEAFAIHIAGDRREVGVKGRAHRGIKHGCTVFGAKDNVRQKIRERLWHGAARQDGSGLQPSIRVGVLYLGRWPRLV